MTYNQILGTWIICFMAFAWYAETHFDKQHPNDRIYNCHNNVVYFRRYNNGDPWNPVYKPDGSILRCDEIQWVIKHVD